MAIPHLPPPIQNGYVVRDLDAAIRGWLQLGVGPFFCLEASYNRVTYRGQPAPLRIDVAFSYWGETQIELICQKDDGPSVYHEFLEEGCQGLHHTLSIVPYLDEVERFALAAGMEVICENDLGENGRVLYIRQPDLRWPLLEIGQLAPSVLGFFATIRQAVDGWDGNEPIRHVDRARLSEEL